MPGMGRQEGGKIFGLVFGSYRTPGKINPVFNSESVLFPFPPLVRIAAIRVNDIDSSRREA